MLKLVHSIGETARHAYVSCTCLVQFYVASLDVENYKCDP